MKKQSVQFFTGMIGSILISLLVSFSAMAYPSGSPAGYTGSPGDGQHCVSCHNGSAATVSGWITTNIPAAGYTAGTIYTITVTVSGSGKKGFEVSPQNATGTQLGVLAAGTNNHLVGGTKYVTQNSSGSTSSTVIWNFTWTAPAAGTGSVTFYGAFTVGKSITKLSTTVVSENTAMPLAVVATANPTSILPGATSQLNATASGGTGTYTYAWTSVPAGFTSALQNPLVSPTVTTQYNVTVNDGAGNAQGNVTVTVTAVPLSATASATPSVICAGQSSQLYVVAMGGIGNYTYSWTSVPAGFTSNLQNPVVTPAVATQYFATVSDGTSSVDAPTSVAVNQPATAAAGNDTTCAFITTQVPLNGMAANYATIQWTTSGTGTFSAGSALAGYYLPTIADKTAGSVTLTLTASAQAPCTATAADMRIIHFDGPIGMGDIRSTQISMIISPNPSTGLFSIKVSGIENEKSTVTVSDIRGRAIVQHAFDASGLEHFDISGYPKGLYLVKIQTETESMVRKLVVE